MDNRRFVALYNNSLSSILNHYNSIRKGIRTDFIVMFSVLIGGFMFEVITWMLIGIVAIFIILLSYIRRIKLKQDVYHRLFPSEMSSAVLKDFDNSLEVNKNRYLAKDAVMDLFYPEEIKHYEGGEFFEGTFNGIPVEGSSIHWKTVTQSIEGILVRAKAKKVGHSSTQFNDLALKFLSHEPSNSLIQEIIDENQSVKLFAAVNGNIISVFFSFNLSNI